MATSEMDRRLAANQRAPKLVVVIEEIGDLLMVKVDVASQAYWRA